MSGGCDTTPEDRERWSAEADRERARRQIPLAEPTLEDREQWRTEAIAREQTAVATAKEIERVAPLLPPEEVAAKRYLMGFAAGLRHRGR